MTSPEQSAAIERLRRLRRVYHLAFVATLCAALARAIHETLCCGHGFFARVASLDHTWAGFPTDRLCGHCRFDLYGR